MSREPHNAVPAGRQLAVLFGPERVALALSVLVVIALAFVLGVGPFATRAEPSASPVPAATGAAPSGISRLAVGPLSRDTGPSIDA